MKRIFAILLCCCLLTGCSLGKDDPYVPTGKGLTWDEGYTGPTVTEPVEETVQELTLTCYPDATMNPLLCTEYTNRALFSLLYQSLFVVDREYQVEPMLCKYFTRSEDMKTYTFYLEDATFSDGSRLTAKDVMATLLAAKESTWYGGRFTHIGEISLAGENGVTVQLDTAYENLPILLDIPIIKANQLESDFPLGTGPYVLEHNALGMRLRRRNNWWCSAEMTVTAPAISIVAAESTTQIRDEFEFSDLGLVLADPGSDNYADFRCDFELWDCESGIFLYLACNMNSELFADPAVRSALSYAVDRDTIAEKYYRGFARSAVLPMSPQSPYYSQKLAEEYAFDGVKFAQALNDASIFQEEPAVFLVNSDDSLRVRVARKIRDMLVDCGLKVTMKEVTSSEYKTALLYRTYDLYLGQTKLSPNMDLSAFFYTYGDLSYGSIDDVATYALCLEALANHGNYYTLHKKIMEEGLLCPILFRSYAVHATRGLLSDLTPARDNVFYYSLGKTMEDALKG